MASSDIIKIGFDYRSSLEQFEKDTNGVFDGISNKAGKQKITIQLDAKDDKIIEKIKELQKLKLDKFTFEFGNSGLKEQLQTFDKLENKINEIINLGKGKSFIDSSSTVADIGKIVQNTNNQAKAIDKVTNSYKNQAYELASVLKMLAKLDQYGDVPYAEAFSKAVKSGAKSYKNGDDIQFAAKKYGMDEESIKYLRGLSVNLSNAFNYTDTLGLDTANITNVEKLTEYFRELLKEKLEFNNTKLNTSDIEELIKALGIAKKELFDDGTKSGRNIYGDGTLDKYSDLPQIIQYLKQQETQAIATAEAEQKLAEAQKETASNTSNSNNSQIEELKSDIQEVKTELGDVKDRISSIESNGFENVREDVEKTKESVKELNSELTEMKSNLSSTPQESNISLENNPKKDAFPNTDTKLDEAVISAKDLDKTLKQVDIPTDSFDKVLEKLDRTKSELVDIVKITKQSVSDKDGKFHDSYTLKDNRGSTEIYGTNSKTDKGQILRQNIVGYDVKKDTVDNSKELLAIEKQLQKEIEASDKANQKKFQDFQKEQADYAESVNKVNSAIQKTDEILDTLPLHDKLDGQFLDMIDSVDNLNSKLKSGELTLSEYKNEVKSVTSEYSKMVSIQQKRDVEDYNANAKANLENAKNIQAEWDKNIKAIQDYMDAMTKLNNLKAKDKGTGSEENQIALQIQNVEELKQTAWDARQNLSSIQAENPDIIAWKQWVDMMELFDQASKGSAESAAKLKDVLDNIKVPSLDKYENKLVSYQTKKGAYDATIARFKDGGWTSDKYLKNVQAVKDAVKKYEDLLSNIKAKGGITSEEDVQKLKEYESEIKKTISTVTNMSAAEKGYNFVSAQKELDKIHKLLNENSKMSSKAKAKIQAYYREIESGNPSMSLDKIHGKILKIYNAEVEAGRVGKSLWDTFKTSRLHQIVAQAAGMFGVYDVINLGKQAFSTVKELDYALVDLKKTTAMNSSELEQFYYDSNDVAKQMGVTTKEIIDQASSWSRLGYNSKQAATEMAKLSSQFSLISPGMDTTTAQEGLVSIMKAWDIGYQDVKSQIMDDINALGNAMAEDNQDIVEGMERSAAALAAVGTSTKDAFALFSGIQEVLQNSEKSGTSLRSVALRLRSFDETTGEYSEDLANITGELADLTKTAEHAQGVSVFKPGSTTEFKSLVDYFREIADIWDEMSQKQQNDFLLKAFGRTQAQAGAALIQNFKGVEKALDVMDNAAGSADKEMETAKQSITYKLNELKETWVGTVQDIANRDDLGRIVDGLIDLSSAIGFVIDKLGLAGTVGLFGGAGAGIFKFIKNFDWVFKPYTKTLSNSF